LRTERLHMRLSPTGDCTSSLTTVTPLTAAVELKLCYLQRMSRSRKMFYIRRASERQVRHPGKGTS
jgi:hypothetical protein